MNKLEENVNVKNQVSLITIVKDVNDEVSVVPEYYKRKDAADYVSMTEAMIEELTDMGVLRYAVSFPDGQQLYSIDELDRLGKTILYVVDNFIVNETDTTE